MTILLNASPPQRVFLATADPVAQAAIENSAVELKRQAKLLILLGHEVLIGAPFAWQSDATNRTILELAPLVDARSIELMGRPDMHLSTDYLKERLLDTERIAELDLPPHSPYATEVPTETAIHVARRLDSLSKLAPRRRSVESLFRHYYVQDLEWYVTPNSLDARIRTGLPTRFSSIGRVQAEALLNRLRQLPFEGHFSRAVIAAATANARVPQCLSHSLMQRSTGLYLAANALACDASLFTWSPDNAIPSDVSYCHRYSISPSNPYLFLKVLNVFGVPRQLIDSLPHDKLVRIVRTAPELTAFVAWYRPFIEAIAGSEPNSPTSDAESLYVLGRVNKMLSSSITARRYSETFNTFERWRLDWVAGALAGLVSLKFGFGAMGAARTGLGVRSGTTMAFDFIRRRCELALTKPLTDFDALVLREGLRKV